MKTPVAYYPALIALYPALAVYAANMSLWSFSEIALPSIVSLGIVAVLWLISGLLTRSSNRGALIASALVACFFLFRTVDAWMGLWGWIFVTVVALTASAWRWKSLILPTRFLNAASVVLIVLSLGTIIQTSYRIQRSVSSNHARTALAATTQSPERLPDVFYIILDGYGRADELERNFGIDNQPFLKKLEDSGFIVCNESYANYCQTEISLASSLNMGYIEDFFQPSKNPIVDRAVLDQSIDESTVAKEFKERGYVYVGITTGFPALEFKSADITLPREQQHMLLSATLIQMTPLRASGRIIMSQFDERRQMLRSGIDALGSLARRGPRPRFVVAHILAPHPPFVFGPNGEEKRPKTQFAYADGSHFFDNGGTGQGYREGYRDQIQWLNKVLIPELDAILEVKPTPIVVLQGDHGSKLKLDQESASRSDLKEVFGNLMAVRVPESMRERIPMNLTPVNLFRILLGRLFGIDLPMLANRSFYSRWTQPLEFADVTDKLGESTNVQEAGPAPRP